MLGKLSWDAIPFNNPIVLIAFSPVVVLILFLLGLLTVKGWWPYLWREWITSVDHKRIGVMICHSGARHACTRFCGCHHDANAARIGGRRSAGLCNASQAIASH